MSMTAFKVCNKCGAVYAANKEVGHETLHTFTAATSARVIALDRRVKKLEG